MECPNLAQLSAFALGDLLEHPTEIAQHVHGCSTCNSTIAQLSEDMDIGTELDVPLLEEHCNEPEFVAAMQVLRQQTSLSYSTGMATLAQEMIAVGDEIGPYRLVEFLGQGAMGIVHRANHTKLDKIVALKILPANVSQQRTARFEREMQTVGRLNHENVVSAYDAGLANGVRYLAMEYVDGVTLTQLVESPNQLTTEAACELIVQAASGLQAAHAQQVIHRDVKPQNLMLSNDGTVKLLDLGLAHVQHEAASELTGQTQVLGTLDFISPEQLSPDKAIDHRADIYSLGCTFYYLLTGTPPFANCTTPSQKMMAHLHSNPESLQSLRSDCPVAVEAVVQKMMAKAPDERFKSADEVVSALQLCMSNSKDITTAPHLVRTREITQRSYLRNTLIAIALVGVAAVSAAVISIQLAKGTIVLSADDSVAVTYENEQVRIIDKETGRRYQLSLGKSKLLAGNYEIHVADDSGLKFSATEFSLSRGKETALDVRFEPTKKPTKQSPKKSQARTEEAAQQPNTNGTADNLSLDTDDEIAAWAFGRGAHQVHFRTVSGESHIAENRFQLRNDCRVTSIDFRHLKTIGDDDIQKLSSLEHLEYICLTDTSVTNDAMQHLRSIPSLELIDLGILPSIDAEGLRELVGLPNLKTLRMWQNKITHAELEEISKMSMLKELWIGLGELDDDALHYLGNLKQLRSLYLYPTKITGTGFRHLGNIPIEDITLETAHLSVEGVEQIAKLKQLKGLTINTHNVTDSMLQKLLPELVHLEHLTIDNSQITKESLPLFAKLPKLNFISMRNTAVDDEWLPDLLKMKHVTQLGLGQTAITDAGIESLETADHLRLLRLHETAVSRESILRIRSKLPNCLVEANF